MVEVMVATLIMSILVMAMSSTMIMLYEGKKDIELSEESNEFVNELKVFMANSTNCKAVMLNKNIDRAGAPVALTLPMTYKGNAGNWAAGAPITQGLTVSSLDLKIDNGIAPSTVNMDVSGTLKKMDRFNGVIQVQFARQSGIISKPYFIPLKVVTDGVLGTETAIQDCVMSETDDVDSCIGADYRWDSVAGKCLPTDRCIYGGSYADPGAPGTFINMMTGGRSCPANYHQFVSGSIVQAGKSGKYGYSNTAYPVYDCLKCYGSSGNINTPAGTTGTPSTTNIDVSGGDLATAEGDLATQRDTLIANLDAQAAAPGFVCNPPGTVFQEYPVGTTCQVPPDTLMSLSTGYCCSGSADICVTSINIGVGGPGNTIDYIKKASCR